MPTSRKTWQEKATSTAILKKVNRKNSPVTSLVQLADEFGAPVNGPYFFGDFMTSGRTTSPVFRSHVRRTVGTKAYNSIRQENQVRV